MKLAVERRARLEESRKLGQFYWDMADEENWMKEKEQILSTGDIGHDFPAYFSSLFHYVLQNC